MQEMWKKVLAEIEQTIPREQFFTWFTGVDLLANENGVVVVGVPNVFKRSQLQSKYTDVIMTALKHNGVTVERVDYQVISEKRARRRAEVTVTPTVAKTAQTSSGFGKTGFTTGLNPRYTMDNFVVGSNNDLAVSVARNIIDNPGKKYNPFFLYGGPGLGKTHLIHAIGNALLTNNDKLKVFYTPISNFYSEFIKSIQNKTSDEFRQRFMKLDVLIIDDFQMIMNKDASQVEFFDIFNNLYQANKHIIVTSDRLPSQIKSVDERLASRLTWAGAYDLQMPTFEDRCAILRSKAEYEGMEIEDEAIEYIAENVQTNIRALEGELAHLMAVADIKNMSPLAVIKEGYMNTSATAQNKSVAPKQVVEKVAKYYSLSVKEMCGKSRVAHIKNARQVAMYLLSKELGMSTTKIALEVGVSDHTTVMHGIKKIDRDLKLDFNLRDQLAAIKEKIYE